MNNDVREVNNDLIIILVKFSILLYI